MDERLGAAPVNPKPFHFVTWNDEGTGEYCLWTIIANRKEKETIQFEWYPRLLYPKIRDSVWLEVSNHPELFALAPLTMLRLRLRTGSPCLWRAFRTRTRPRTLFWISSFRPRKAASC
jgi:hypothetical protein